MVIPFTDRFKTVPVILFGSLVFIAQQLEHTDITFSLLTFAFTVLSAAAYNAAGGLSYPSGAYIFFNATLTAILGITVKVFFLEPGETNLHAPNTTMLVYCVGMSLMLLLANFNGRLRPKRALLPNLEVSNMRYAALGCLLVGVLVQLLTTTSGDEAGTISSALRQLNYLPRMAMIFATIYQMEKSDGKSATNWIVWLSGAFMFAYGIISFSKEGLFMAPVTWGLTAILYRFRFNWKHIAFIVSFAVFSQIVLVPFSQYGRRSRANSVDTTYAMALQSAIDYLKDPLGTRADYVESLTTVDIDSGAHLYSTQQPFLERMIMLPADDAIVALTDGQAGTFGLMPTWDGYINIIPRFLWKDKITHNYGNLYAHEMGILADDDTTTGIAFSPLGDAYHEASWFGILVIFPPVIFLFFLVTDSLTGSVRDSPYAMLPIALTAHAAPEGMLTGAIYLQTYGAMLLIIVAFSSKYVLARFTRLTLGGDRVRVLRTRDFILGSRQVRPVPQPGAPGGPRP